MAEKKESAEAAVRTIRRVTRKKYSAEEQVRIVLPQVHRDDVEGLRGKTSIAALCRRAGNHRTCTPDTCAAPQAVSARRATGARGPNGVR